MLPVFLHGRRRRGRSWAWLAAQPGEPAGGNEVRRRASSGTASPPAGIDEVHIGLNDLSIELGCEVILEPVCTAMIDETRRGAARGRHAVRRRRHWPAVVRDASRSPERMLAEQVRLGCTRGWLGRTFRGDLERSRARGELAAAVLAIREAVRKWQSAPAGALLKTARHCTEKQPPSSRARPDAAARRLRCHAHRPDDRSGGASRIAISVR